MALEELVKGALATFLGGAVIWRYKSWRAYVEASNLLIKGKSKEEVENIMYYPSKIVPLDVLSRAENPPVGRSRLKMAFDWIGKLGYYKACKEYDARGNTESWEFIESGYSEKKGRSIKKKL